MSDKLTRYVNAIGTKHINNAEEEEEALTCNQQYRHRQQRQGPSLA
jgi:hypothetical protein